MSDTTAMLPCPGCGGTCTRVIGGPGTRGGPKHWAGCDHCRWRTWGDTEAEAIAAWNRRAALVGQADAVATYGIRSKGTGAIVGIVPEKVASTPSTSPAYLRDYEEVPLYTTPPAAIPVDALRAKLMGLEDGAQNEVSARFKLGDTDSRAYGYWMGKNAAFGEAVELLEPDELAALAAAAGDWPLQEIGGRVMEVRSIDPDAAGDTGGAHG